jgi:capsular exopolysaccharide synthesis family protein
MTSTMTVATQTLIPRPPAGAAESFSLDALAPLVPPQPPPANLVALADPESLGAEQYRRLAIGLQHMRLQRPLRTVLVTSAAPGEGKSLSAANLALTLARPGGERVLLMDGDLHRPSLPARLGVGHERGLADWLEGRQPLARCLARWPGLPLALLPAAHTRGLPLELLQARPPAQILAALHAQFEWVILDSPPLLPMADACHWARAADGVLFIVRENHTRRSELLRALRQIERDKWLGVVLNQSSTPEDRYYAQYYPGRA